MKYKKEEAFRTACGGCVSIFLMLAFLITFSFALHDDLTNPKFDSYPSESTIDTDVLTMSTMNSTVAIALKAHRDDGWETYKESQKDVRVLFNIYYRNKLIGEAPSAYCSDLYKEQIE